MSTSTRCGPPTASRRWCPAGVEILDPVGTAPGVVVTRARPTVVVLPGPPRELQPMWRPRGHRRRPAGHRGPHDYRQDTIRMFGLPESGLAETLREARIADTAASTAWRSPPACAAGSSRSSRATSPPAPVYAAAGRAAAGSATAVRSSPRMARWSTTRSHNCLPAGHRDGGILHRRLAGRPADRPARFVGVRRGRGGVVLQRGQGRAARCRSGVDRRTRRGVRTGGRGDGGRRAGAGSVPTPRRDHRNRRPGRRQRRKSRLAQCVSACDAGVTVRCSTRTLLLPGNRSDIRERSTTVAMHMLRRMLGADAD